MSHTLAKTDHISMNEFADFLEHQAEMIRHEAQKKAISPDAKQAGAIDYLLRTPRIVLRHLSQGNSLDDAIEKTATYTGAPVSSIKRTWWRFTSDKSIYELRRRNRLIIELAAMGFTNADIGKKVYLHPHSVSRIIAQARRVHHIARITEKNTELILNGGALSHNDSNIF